MKIAVAIDGPAAAGKSTIAKKVASIMGYTYIDTGAMYRAFTWYCLNNNIDCKNENECSSVIDKVKINLLPSGIVMCNEVDVTRAIREINVSSNVSYIASYPKIREALVEQQREMSKHTSVIMDGRDIGTTVLPNAEVKIFQVATPECRAMRRYKENQEKGIPCTYQEIIEDVNRRDYIDSHRSCSPLKAAEDAIHLDTSNLTIDEVVAEVIKIINQKIKG